MEERQQVDAANTFIASWTPSKSTALAATSIPLLRQPRAWELKPKSGVKENGRVKTVWKRYGLRSQPEIEEPRQTDEAVIMSPGAVVKKLRVASPAKGAVQKDKGRRKSAATKYERRKSGYRRKPATVPVLDAPDLLSDLQLDSTKHVDDGERDEVHNFGNEEGESMSQEQETSICEAAEAQLLGEADGDAFQIESDLFENAQDVSLQSLSAIVRDLPEDLGSGQREAAFALVPDTSNNSPSASDASSEASNSSSPIRDASDDDARLTFGTFTAQQLVEFEEAHAKATEITICDEAQKHSDTGAVETTTDLIFGDKRMPDLSSSMQDVPDYFAEAAADESPSGSWSSKRGTQEPEGSNALENAVTISLNDATVNLGALLSRHQNLAAVVTDDAIELEEVDDPDTDEATEEATTRLLNETEAEKDEEERCSSPDELSMEFDQTETMSLTTPDATAHLEDDKAKLSSFLQRVAANKANKSANITRRESLQNRRDSDVVRKALASPRQVLKDKDANLSPQRSLESGEGITMNLDQVLLSPFGKAITKTGGEPGHTNTDDGKPDDLALSESGSPRRRSSRTRTKLPTLSNATASLKIPVRTDGGGSVVLNRSEAQQLADLVRRNTKKNKGTSIPAPQRLAKLKFESLSIILDGASPVVENLRKEGVKSVEWNTQLVEFATSPATADLEAAKDELPPKLTAEKKTETPRMRRLKGLGASNGTPAKKVLQSTLLPDEMEEAAAKNKEDPPKPAESELSKIQKKSKLQPPKKLVALNPTVASLSGLPVLGAGKENNTSALMSPAKKMGSKIPAPSGIPALTAKRLKGIGKKS